MCIRDKKILWGLIRRKLLYPLHKTRTTRIRVNGEASLPPRRPLTQPSQNPKHFSVRDRKLAGSREPMGFHSVRFTSTVMGRIH